MGYVSGYILCVPCLFATCVDFVSQWSPAEPLLTVSCMLSPFHTLMMFAEFPMMRLLVTTLLVSFFLLPTCHAADELTLQPLTEQVEQYGRIEFVIGVDRQYAHPFDPEEVKLDLVIRAPQAVTHGSRHFTCKRTIARKSCDRDGRRSGTIHPACRDGERDSLRVKSAVFLPWPS